MAEMFRGESKLFDKQSKAASGGQGAGSQYAGQRPGDIPDWQAGFEFDEGIEVRDPLTGNYYRALNDHVSTNSFAADLANLHWELIAGAGAFLSGVPVNQTVYVDAQYGNNGTGARERVDLPYQTITAALAAAVIGDTVWVRPGIYNERILGKDQVNMHLMLGASLTFTAFGVGGAIIDDSAANGTGGALRMRITGEGSFTRLGSGLPLFGVYLENAQSEIYIEGKGYTGESFSFISNGKLTARFENDILLANAGSQVSEVSGGEASIHADRILGGANRVGSVSGGELELKARKINCVGGGGVEMIQVTGGKLSVNNTRVEQDGVAVSDHAFRIEPAGILILTDVTIVLGNTANEDVNAPALSTVHLYGDTRSNAAAKNGFVVERVNSMNRDSNVI